MEDSGDNFAERKNAEGGRVHFDVLVSTDRDHFFRLTCPSCGRDFKIQIDQSDLQWALGSYCQRVGYDIGLGDSRQRRPDRIRCPYCAYGGESVQMHTEETVAYFRRIIRRELVIPMLNKWASGLEESLGGGGHSGGLFSMSVEVKHSRSVLPVRPMHGPEPPDLKIVTFLCCGKKIKIADGWTDVRVCSYCGTEVALI